MSFKSGLLTACLAGLVLLPVTAFALIPVPTGCEEQPGGGAAAASDSPPNNLFADGTKAIDQGRWAEAVKIFSAVADQHGEHADGALYWKAYAENKLGLSKASVEACRTLRQDFPKSKWVEDCGALEVELNARSGKPVEIDPNASDDVKLLALNTMLRQDEPRALAEIQEILKGDSSEKLKKEAQFILGTHYSDTTYAQAVRISYLEGDVRIQRGDPSNKTGGATWEKATSGLPLETGFSLVTGVGARAEIEFENASTVYLGENSVLTFNDLHETAGVPYTEMGLLAGTLSLYFRPYVAQEKLVLHTPTSDFISKFPDKTYARVESFTDAVSVPPLEGGGSVRLPGVPRGTAIPDRTFTWLQGQLVDPEGSPDTQKGSPWDKWVAGRVADRITAIQSVMAQSGLSEPIPGLADLAGRGKFFDCAPYGTCWEPNGLAAHDHAAMRRPRRPETPQPHLELAAYHPLPRPFQPAQFGSVAPLEDDLDSAYDFPCTPISLLYRMMKDPATGKLVQIRGPFPEARPYDWAVCHAGSWIRHHKHYVWCAGTKRHHIPPVRWIKVGRSVAFVPLHPYDVKGQPAINAKHVVFAVSGKIQIEVHPIRFDSGVPIQYLKDPPKDYRVALLNPLPGAEAPHMEARSFNRVPGSIYAQKVGASVPLHFDPKSQSFLVAREQIRAGRSSTVFVPMNNRTGSLQSRADSFGGSAAYHGSTSASSSGFHGGGASSGGASHSGSSASSGGGFHGSGGTVSVSSGVSSAAASSATAASSSSAHH